MNKQFILKKTYDIEKLVKAKKSVGNKYYAIYYKKAPSFKIVVSASKKIGKAYCRNYQRRVTKEIIRTNMNSLVNLKELNVLIVVKKNSLELNYIEKEKEIIRLIKSIKVM